MSNNLCRAQYNYKTHYTNKYAIYETYYTKVSSTGWSKTTSYTSHTNHSKNNFNLQSSTSIVCKNWIRSIDRT